MMKNQSEDSAMNPGHLQATDHRTSLPNRLGEAGSSPVLSTCDSAHVLLE